MAKVQKTAYNCSTRERKTACAPLYVDAVRPNSLFGGFRAGATTCGRTTTIGTIRQPKFPWLHFTPRYKVGEQIPISCHTWVWTTPKWNVTMKSETKTHLPNSRCILGLVASPQHPIEQEQSTLQKVSNL